MSFLAALSPEARAELATFVDERVAAAFAAQAGEPQKRWLTAAEAADYLGTTSRAVYMRITRGRIPAGTVHHVGRSLLIDRLALDRMLEAQR